jgi:hypothetical protein
MGPEDSMRAAFVAACVSLVALSGCVTASGPDPVNFKREPPKAGFATLYVGRPGGPGASAEPLSIDLDGQPLAVLGFGTYTRIELRPGRYRLAARDDVVTRTSYGISVPAELTVEPGKAYYALPTAWAADVRRTVTVVNDTIIPERTTANYGTFTVETKAARAVAPAAFRSLTYVPSENLVSQVTRFLSAVQERAATVIAP